MRIIARAFFVAETIGYKLLRGMMARRRLQFA